MEPMCAVEECGKPAKVDGMCVRHACEAAKRQHLLAAGGEGEVRGCACGEPLTPAATGEKCERCRKREANRRWTAKQKEKEMGAKTMECSTCRRAIGDGERAYKGMCEDCRVKARQERKVAKKSPGKEEQPITHNERVAAAAIGVSPQKLRKEIEKNRPKSRGLSESELITAVKGSLNYHLEEARRCHTTLVVLKDLTGSDIEVPEVRL